jgi:hypothetical protein
MKKPDLQDAKRISAPITMKYEEKRLQKRIGRGLANAFWNVNNESQDYLSMFSTRFGIYDSKI